MSSQFDVTVAFLQDVYKQASLDSQKLQAEMRTLREQLEQLQKNIENRTDNIVREITPRIEQLEEKMRNSWGSIEAMDKLSWEELDHEKEIFINCEKIVQEMDLRIADVQQKV